uniref:Putative late blight resistance protein, identical n=1 Tax=Solanum demissum TaxID=50514 RepID=Q6L3X2_SOLDE|nr:Putative late blight resistance protein, identical [Solanum demissum]
MIEIWKIQCLREPYDCPDPFLYKTLYVYDSFGYWNEVIWKTKQEFRAEYSFPNTSLAANKVDDVSPKFVMEVIDVFVENLNVLVKINDPYSWPLDQSTKAVCSHKQHAHLAFTEMDNLVEWSASCSLVGSVLFKSYDPNFTRRLLSSHAFAVSHILLNFKFLKVLDLEHQVVIDFIPTELPYLRYFSALIDQNSIPSSISNLWNLETLILKRRLTVTHGINEPFLKVRWHI